ncbi:MAG TPA: ATP-binding cassette domain-containing protein, partial [Deltaproteobacteria bacterium]|nr:ATP-binding cassette domain-containing protein [Deltaproteobacteria bacterium]
MIKVINLYKKIEKKIVLNGLNLHVQKGKITVITGLSGSGKSILLKTIVGLVKPDSGKIIVDGEDISTLKGAKLINFRKKIG